MADRLPIDPDTGHPLIPRARPGYYPGYHTLSQQNFWDEATRRTVLDRVNTVPPFRFFTPEEIPLLRAICARVLPQDDRDAAHQIPIAEQIDTRLHAGRIDGYRYEDMPPDGEAHRLGLRGIDAIARHLHERPFVALEPLTRDLVPQTLHRGEPPAGDEIWRRPPVDRHGLRVAKVTFNLRDNDKKLIAFGKEKVEAIMRAAGAAEVVQEARYAHLVGAARAGGRAWNVMQNGSGSGQLPSTRLTSMPAVAACRTTCRS